MIPQNNQIMPRSYPTIVMEEKGNACLAGRSAELQNLKEHLAGTSSGEGRTLIVTGEPGIGKSRLIAEFLSSTEHARVLKGHAYEGNVRPFGAFSEALADIVSGDLFQEEEYTGFSSVFLINDSGMLLAQSSAESETLDPDIFAGMLSAVQNFVRDSFDATGKEAAGLGKLVYGDMTIMMEHAPGMFITAVAAGKEHPQMTPLLVETANGIGMKHGETLARWTGNMRELEALQRDIDGLAARKFLVKKDLAGVKFENERLRIAENAMTSIGKLSGREPLVLLLEDIHWADESSLFLFAYFARNIADKKILLVATARKENNHDFSKFRESLLAEGTALELNLSGLDRGGVSALAAEMFSPNEFSGEFVERLAADSAGNPLFITEALRQMAADGGIVLERGAYNLARDDYKLPGSVEEIVQRRLDSLDPDAVTVAEYASCIGLDFDAADLGSLAMLGNTDRAVGILIESGVFAPKDGGLKFSHAMFRQVTYSGVSGRWKSVYHRNLGEYCERTRDSRGGDVVYELARHYSACGAYPKAFGYLLEAGERAEGAFAAELAREFYRTAIEILPKLGEAGVDTYLKASILEKLADSERMLGAAQDAVREYEAALPLLAGERRLSVVRKAAKAHEIAGELDRAMALLRTAIPLDEGVSPDIGSRLLAEHAQVSARMGDKDAARASCILAREMLEAVEDPGTRVSVFTLLGNAYEKTGPEETSHQMFQSAVEEAERSGDIGHLATAYAGIGLYMHFRGEHAVASRLIEKAVTYMDKRGDIVAQAHTLVTLGMAYSDCGELEKSLACLKRALVLFRKIGNRHSIASTLGNIGYTLAMMGMHAESLEHQTESLDIRRSLGSENGMAWSYLDMSMVHVQLGMLDVAAQSLAEAIELFAESDDPIGLCCAKTSLAEVRMFQNDNAVAVSLLREGLELAEQKKLARLKFQTMKNLVELGAESPAEALPEMERIAETLANTSLEMVILKLRGDLAYASNDAAGAERNYDAGLAKGLKERQIDTDLATAELLQRRARLYWRTGRPEMAVADAAKAKELYGRWGRVRESGHIDGFVHD